MLHVYYSMRLGEDERRTGLADTVGDGARDDHWSRREGGERDREGRELKLHRGEWGEGGDGSQGRRGLGSPPWFERSPLYGNVRQGSSPVSRAAALHRVDADSEGTPLFQIELPRVDGRGAIAAAGTPGPSMGIGSGNR